MDRRQATTPQQLASSHGSVEPMKTVPAATFRLLENFSIWTRLCMVSVFLYTGLSTQEGFRVNNERSGIECNCTANVDDYGAKGDGVTDDSKAFVAAWNAACKNRSNSVFLVPHGKSYLVGNPINLNGPCECNLTAQISGRIIAHRDACRWNPHARQEWLMFSKVQELTISGGGIIDGAGGDCNRDRKHICSSVPTALVVNSSKDVHLKNLTFHVSPKIHVEINQSTYVEVENLKIVAPGDSPNTDGIHVYDSQHVVIQNCTIATGDDCASIVTGSSSIQINKLVCGPGQGISIGSLGSGNSEDTVSDVIVNGASLTASQNGVRVETGQSSAVRVHNVTGSGSVPSTKIVMEGVSLRLDNGDPATSFSDNVQGSSDGQVIPPVKLMLLGLEATD